MSDFNLSTKLHEHGQRVTTRIGIALRSELVSRGEVCDSSYVTLYIFECYHAATT